MIETYGTSRTTEERYIEDEKLVESLIEDLEGEEAVAAHRELTQFEGAKAVYNLDHEYSGDAFMECLVNGDEVTARVNLTVDYGSSSEVYDGRVTDAATEIFSLQEPEGSELSMDSENVSHRGSAATD